MLEWKRVLARQIESWPDSVLSLLLIFIALLFIYLALFERRTWLKALALVYALLP